MRPTEADIQYCLKHKEDIARWLVDSIVRHHDSAGGWPGLTNPRQLEGTTKEMTHD